MRRLGTALRVRRRVLQQREAAAGRGVGRVPGRRRRQLGADHRVARHSKALDDHGQFSI